MHIYIHSPLKTTVDCNYWVPFTLNTGKVIMFIIFLTHCVLSSWLAMWMPLKPPHPFRKASLIYSQSLDQLFKSTHIIVQPKEKLPQE